MRGDTDDGSGDSPSFQKLISVNSEILVKLLTSNLDICKSSIFSAYHILLARNSRLIC
jgi:hypothetical protein